MTDPTITIAGLRARINSLLSAVQHSNRTTAERVTMFVEASSNADRLTAERDALAAQLAEARAALDAAPKVCAVHSYEHGPGPCMTCGAWPPGTRELIAAYQTRIAGLEQAAGERGKEVARLKHEVHELYSDRAAYFGAAVGVAQALGLSSLGPAGEDPRFYAEALAFARSLEGHVKKLTSRVAELEARPVLTHEILSAAIEKARKVPPYVARQAADEYMPHLCPVTLPPAQDDPMRHHESRDYALQSPANGYWPADVGAVNGTEALAMGAMLRSVGPIQINDVALLAMARAAIACVDKLGAPPTSPPAARPVFAWVSEEELDAAFEAAYRAESVKSASGGKDPRRAAIRAVLARLEVSLVTPVDPEAVAREYHASGALPDVPSWTEISSFGRHIATQAMRTALRASGIPVTPEVDK